MTVINDLNIRAEDNWFRYEHKVIEVTVVDSNGAPVDVSASSLQWRLYRYTSDNETVIHMEIISPAIEVSGANNNIVDVIVEPNMYEATVAGKYRHELWDRTNKVVLVAGSAMLLDALPETVT